MDYVEEAMALVVRLAQQAGLGPLYVVGLLLAAALLLMVARHVKLPPPRPEEPRPDAEPWQPDAENPGGPGGGG
jgi:hypothetical protein